MCGIAGIFVYRQGAPRADRDDLLRIRDAMNRRGPDGAGLWIADDGCAGLAQRRLAIIDLSDAGAQPMASGDGRLRVVFNGEIYNYRQLRAELEKKGCRFRSQSDTEVLLHLYAERGADMVHALRGMYAFAIWDENKKGLLLVRDPFGIKPLYYADDGNIFRFASQVKALLRGTGIDAAPDPAGHVGFFLWGSVPEPYTLYKGIRALPAGTTLWVSAPGDRRPAPFFNVAETLSAATAGRPVDRDEGRQRLRAALLDSVRHHLVADVPVGVFLSAGLDSATLTALAAESSSAALHTITLGFNEYRGTENDETILAAGVAEQYRTSHHTRWVSREDFQSECDRLLQAMDQPTIDGVNTYFVSKAAAESGLKVAISGLGGDELFGGYPSFREIPKMVRLLSPFRLIPGLGRLFRWVSAPMVKRLTSPKYAGLLEYGGTYGGAYLLRRGFFMPWELPEILGDRITREGWEELQPLMRLEQTIQGATSERVKVSALEMSWYMRNQLLRDADWAGMAHSLEIRVPFVDVELIRRLAPILTGTFPNKQDMALTPRQPLPPGILGRRKTGFTVPVREWLMQDAEQRGGERGLRGWARRVMAMQTAA
jgi:asparagine synthase (glutamine-hydrolysing)